MPARLNRACRIGSCPHPAVDRGRCALHRLPHEAERHRYGRTIYNDSRWKHPRTGLRVQVLLEQPFCACGRLADTVDHIVPHRGDERLAFDRANLRALCASCHSRLTAEQTRRPR